MNENNQRFNFFTMFRDGFRSMTLGKVLWTIVVVKLCIMLVIRFLFFPNVINVNNKTAQEKADYVCKELTK